MPQNRTDTRAFALLALTMLFWAGNSLVGRAVRFDIPPVTLAFLRWSLAFLIVLPLAAGALWRDRFVIARNWGWIVLLGLLGVGAFNTLLYSGLQHTTATNALLLQAALPAFVVLFDRVIFGVRPLRLQLLGVLISIVGVLAIVFRGDPAAVLQLGLGPGDLYVLAAVTAWSLYTVLLRRRPDIAPVSFLAATFAVGVLVNLPLAAAEWQSGARVVWSAGALAAVAYVGVFPSLLAYYSFNAATAQLGAIRAGQALTLMPLFGALLSALLLGEELHLYHLAGMALILAGIALGVVALRGNRPLAQVGASR